MEKIHIKIYISALIILFLIPALVFARAGDGHGGEVIYETDSWSFDSDWGNDITFIFRLIWLIFDPSIPIFVKLIIIGIIVVLFLRWSKKWSRAAESLEILEKQAKLESQMAYNVPSYAEKKQKFIEFDPMWNEQKFKELANTAFFKIENAWCLGDMTTARMFLSDGVMKRFSLQLEPYISQGQRNILGQLSLDSVDITDIRFDDTYSYITTKITATCTDTVVNHEWVIVASNYDGKLTVWREQWIWMRSNKVKTTEIEKWVFADICPNCGASLKINAIGKCDYCGTELTKWEYDWVLSEITQIQ